MAVKLYQRDYARSDEKCFYSMDRNYETLRELTYAEMCSEMQKDLEEMVDAEFLDNSKVCDLVGNIIFYNKVAEKYIRSF
ncbi:hypothetical protein ACJBY2_03220 [Streptococcus suis]|uniref:hypothetical protein n=1 Tax=Streptococcus suis TaxID=1307 RepID=UPI00201A760A|nr:hypothetical protein [Streptococcus suis]MCL4881169.1 hypothetical protein [Streptococcus suis]